MPSPSPASADVSTFPKFSEGESSGTERKSLFNTFTSLWNYRNGDFAPLAYPTLPTEHLYLDNPILLRDDEPTSIIAHALSSKKYYQAFESAGLSRIRAGLSSGGIGREAPMGAAEIEEAARSAEEILRGSSQRSFKLGDVELGDISARCTVFWVEQFEALRQQCGCGTQFIESLARCLKWDAAGGKSKVDFMKTLDDRFIVKQLSRPEMEVFARFAPAYFQYMADALFHSKPTVLAKVFGIYRISLGKHYRNVDFLNLFYGRELKQIFDLKGSTRNRRAEENNPVLLDENLIELSLKSPIYVREESKQLVKEAIYNDSQFLADLNVMDYSLVIGVDATKPELVVGIVDYIRTYTWDKRLESWVKETAFLGGTYKSGGPTVITPKQYKARFREAIDGYLLLVRSRRHCFGAVRSPAYQSSPLQSPTPWLNFEKMRTVPKETHAASLAATNDAASIVDQPTSATASVMEHPHPAPAPPPTDSASIFEAALGPY
ncbi:SAICAR synthase-like protein [Rhodotorula sp. JG-1b]|nr:SAICAR synthase-like protein [Rhodotorula sp. JG-1b]